MASCRLELPKLTLAGQLQIQRKTEKRRTGMFTCPTEDITLRIKVGPYTAVYLVSFKFYRNIRNFDMLIFLGGDKVIKYPCKC